GDALTAVLARWAEPGGPPDGLLGYLEGELPEQASGVAGYALAAARYHLRQAQARPGRAGGSGLGTAFAITGLTGAAWWGLAAVPGGSGRAEAAPLHHATSAASEGDTSVLKAIALFAAVYVVYRVLRAAGEWVGRT